MSDLDELKKMQEEDALLDRCIIDDGYLFDNEKKYRQYIDEVYGMR